MAPPMPEKAAFNSTTVRGAEYDHARRLLTVTFHNGNTETIRDVSPSKWTEFKVTDSPGGFMARNWPKGHDDVAR
jgi:hypothetical protein